MFKNIKAFDRFLYHELPLLLLLIVVVVLRIPNFFDPYWYGDEGIYLTIGTAMRHGLRLYTEIVDHKTPIIYYLSLVQNQLAFRALLTGWMLVTTWAFYHIALRLFQNLKTTIIATLFFIVWTTLPWLEGSIPNGELFVMGFILVGYLMLMHTRLFANFLFEAYTSPKYPESAFKHPLQYLVGKYLYRTSDTYLYFIGGFLLGLGIMTKVPALFDVASILSLSWFTLTNSFTLKKKTRQAWLMEVREVVLQTLPIIVGVITPFLISVIYFVVRGSGAAYLQFGLLYNFLYVQNWSLPFSAPWLLFFFGLPGKLLIAFLSVMLVTILRKTYRPQIQVLLTWFLLALIGSTLSNRPYPHYFLQIIPPASLLFGHLIANYTLLFGLLTGFFRNSFTGFLKLLRSQTGHLESLSILAVFSLWIGVMLLLNVGFYQTVPYYKNFYYYVTGQLSREDYYQKFNSVMRDNYDAAQLITQSDDPYLFIWGTNPMLFALSERVPTGRFTVSFHIKDFNAYEETLNDFKTKQPMFAVVMKNESELPGLAQYLSENYVVNNNFTHFTLWKKNPAQ